MNSSWKIARIVGVDLYLHWSLPLVFVYIFWLSSAPLSEVWQQLTINMLLLLVCVLLHECAHSMAARYFGVRSKRIMLAALGGLVEFERPINRPLPDIIVSLAGPLMNLVLAGFFGLLNIGLMVLQMVNRNADLGILTSYWLLNTLHYLYIINLILAGFNLLPIFPMDGGRISRAIWVKLCGLIWGRRMSQSLGIVCIVGVSFFLWDDPVSLLILVAFLWFNLQQFPSVHKLVWRLTVPSEYAFWYGPQIKAKPFCEAQVKKHPHVMQVYYNRALLSYHLGDADASLADVAYLRTHNSHPYDLHRLSVLNYRMYDPQVQAYRLKVEEQVQRDSELHYVLTWIANYQQDPDRALEHLYQGYQARGEWGDFEKEALYFRVESNQFSAQALAYATAQSALFLQENPYRFHSYVEDGLLAFYQHNWHHASIAFRNSIYLNDKEGICYTLLAQAMFMQNQFVQAEQVLLKAELMQGGFEAKLHLGLLYYQQGKIALAEAYWQSFLHIPQIAAYHLFSNKLAALQPSYLPFFEYALPRYAHKAYLHEAHAHELMRLKQAEPALAAYQRAQALYASSEHLHYHLGVCYQALGKHQAAQAEFARAAAQNFNHTHRRWASEALSRYQQPELLDSLLSTNNTIQKEVVPDQLV